jgi:hypothetical protein
MKSREDLVKPNKGFGGFGRRSSLFKKLERRQKKIENPDDPLDKDRMMVCFLREVVFLFRGSVLESFIRNRKLGDLMAYNFFNENGKI